MVAFSTIVAFRNYILILPEEQTRMFFYDSQKNFCIFVIAEMNAKSRTFEFYLRFSTNVQPAFSQSSL